MKYKIKRDNNQAFVAECLELPGCISQGETKAKALKNIKDAVAGYLESLRRYNEPIPPAKEGEQSQAPETDELPKVHCHDCGAELKPDDNHCPFCESKHRVITASEQIKAHDMINLKQKTKGYKKFKIHLKQGEKIAGASKRPAQEFDKKDKECNLRCHIVAEQDANGKFELVHAHLEPLDPNKPVKLCTAVPRIPYRVDHETEAHIVLRHIDPPHRRLVIPKQNLCLSLLKALWCHAGLSASEFAELWIWHWVKYGL